MKKWIFSPRTEGTASRQAHADLPDGTYEREIGREGFFGPATHMYHKHPPTGWSGGQGPLLPRAFDTTRIGEQGSSPWDAAALLGNDHDDIRLWRAGTAMDHLVRNADGDELLFVLDGAGELYCDFGRLDYREGDYILLPRGTMWLLAPAEATTMLMIEAANGAYRLPDKGIAGDHAIFDPAVLETPAMDGAFRAQQDESTWRLVIKRRGELFTVPYPYNPLDAVGWKGNLIPVRLNWRDIRPLMSHLFHLPPSAHSTFVADRFVVCTFVPRPMESDPGALKVPFFHNNDDYDEVIFYHRGEYFGRDNFHPGMISLHPCGFPHGPHPKALEAGSQAGRKDTDEVAVMVDARDALTVRAAAEACEWPGYVAAWGGITAAEDAAE